MFLCTTGNCSWDPIATFGLCSLCADVSPKLLFNCSSPNETYYDAYGIGGRQRCDVALPNKTVQLVYDTDTDAVLLNVTAIEFGEELAYGNTSGTTFHALRLLPPYEFGGYRKKNVTRARFSATECSLDPCVLSLQPLVSQGNYSERVLDVWIGPSITERYWNHVCPSGLRPPWGPERGVGRNQSFGCDERVGLDWMDARFPKAPLTGAVTTWDDNTGIRYAGGPLTELVFNAGYAAAACGSPNADTFACTMRGVGAAMTRAVRNAALLANGTAAADLALGRTHTPAVFVRVRWAWLALPAALWLLGVVTWAAVAVQTRRRRLPAWRESPLPLVFLYRKSGTEVEAERVRDNANWAYELRAKRLQARLVADAEGILCLAPRPEGVGLLQEPDPNDTGQLTDGAVGGSLGETAAPSAGDEDQRLEHEAAGERESPDFDLGRPRRAATAWDD